MWVFEDVFVILRRCSCILKVLVRIPCVLAILVRCSWICRDFGKVFNSEITREGDLLLRWNPARESRGMRSGIGVGRFRGLSRPVDYWAHNKVACDGMSNATHAFATKRIVTSHVKSKGQNKATKLATDRHWWR